MRDNFVAASLHLAVSTATIALVLSTLTQARLREKDCCLLCHGDPSDEVTVLLEHHPDAVTFAHVRGFDPQDLAMTETLPTSTDQSHPLKTKQTNWHCARMCHLLDKRAMPAYATGVPDLRVVSGGKLLVGSILQLLRKHPDEIIEHR